MRAVWRRLSSVRARITILATFVAASALTAAAAGLLYAMDSSLVASRDSAARTRVNDLAALVRANALPQTLPVSGDDFALVLDTHGKVVAASANIASNPPALTPEQSGRTIRNFAVNSDHSDYRVWSVTAETPTGPQTVYIGSSLESVESAVDAVQRTLIIGLPPLLVLLAIGTWLVVGRALRPVEAIRAQVSDISSHALDRRVPVAPTEDEISRLAHTMNEMLDRLQRASERERRFAADAAHELQSPLAAFRTHLEVALAHPDAAPWQSTAQELLQDSQRMEQLVRDLLFLSRAESLPARPTGMVDLDDILLTEAARIRATTAIHVDTSRVSATPITGSRDELTRLTRNLLENAVRHATASVTVELISGSDRVRLTVTDDGQGIPPSDRDRVFQRFARVDDSRSRSFGGTGLGLAIVKDIAERHGGEVWIDPTYRGACFVVELPFPAMPTFAAPS